MDKQDLQHRLELKELEINALLEITQAINNNVPEEALYKIFKFTVISNLKFTKLCLFVRDGKWFGKVSFGTTTDYTLVSPDNSLTQLNAITRLKELPASGPFSEFELVIPIAHRGTIISLLFVGGVEEIFSTSSNDERLGFLQALCNIMVVAIENRKLARKELEQEALRKEMEIASDVQQLLFPENLPRVGPVMVEASYLPHDRVGGDYYDYIPVSENKFLVCIADVSGKGVSAALLMSNFQASLRTLVRQDLDLTEIVSTLNSRVLEITKGERFITCFLALIDLTTNRLTYINAGHIPPVLVDGSLKITYLEHGSTILGAVEKLPAIKKGDILLQLPVTLLCFTDGLTETVDEAGKEFGVSWLSDYLTKNPHPELNRLHQDVIIALDRFKGRNPYRDDITMLSCRIN
jgi:sigma-B regulation protein RsbU (phosphoserine phosphatase)